MCSTDKTVSEFDTMNLTETARRLGWSSVTELSEMIKAGNPFPHFHSGKTMAKISIPVYQYHQYLRGEWDERVCKICTNEQQQPIVIKPIRKVIG
jgi:hypothetical protein